MKLFDQEINEDAYLTYELSIHNTVFSEQGRKNLIEVLKDQPGRFLALYVCEPYTLLIGKLNGTYFLIDTHPVHTLVNHPNKIKTSVLIEANKGEDSAKKLCK